MPLIQGSAKAQTPFGPMAGRTIVTTSYGGDNLVTLDFTCGPTPVMLAVAGASLRELVDQLIGHMGQMNREHAERQLAELDAQVSA